MTSDRSTSGTDETVEMVQEFAADVDEPDNWMISVPVGSFDSVKERLDTDESGLGTDYKGISFCYTQHDDETQIRFKTSLEDWNGWSDHTATDQEGSR